MVAVYPILSLFVIFAASLLIIRIGSFTTSNGGRFRSLVYVLGGVIGIIFIARSRWLNRALTPLIERSLHLATGLDIRDYTKVLGLQRDYRVAEVDVVSDGWLANETPDDVELADEGIWLLGIRRDGTYIGAPSGDTDIRLGDTAVLYGKADRLRELAGRESGDQAAHEEAVEAHAGIIDEQERRLEA